MSDVPSQQSRDMPHVVGCSVVTVSDTHTTKTDQGGQTAIDLLKDAGHKIVAREIIPDEPELMKKLLIALRDRRDVDVILMIGGTGMNLRDHAFETVNRLLDKSLPGYGELFRTLSYEVIGSATILSRATGGVFGQTVVMTMPGSEAAVRLAMEEIILPELVHLVREARR